MSRMPAILVATLFLLLAGCQTRMPLAPTPELLKDPRFDLFTAYQQPDEIHVINSLFATTRHLTDSDRSRFGGQPGNRIHYGTTSLQIAEAEEAESLYDQSTTGARETDFRWQVNEVKRVSSVPRQDTPSTACSSGEGLTEFLAVAETHRRTFTLKELTLYVHGANNTFLESISRGGQSQYFSGDNAPVLTFAWPSPGNIFGYGIDKMQANRAANDLACLIRMLAANTAFERFHLIGYSAGGRVAAGALALLGELEEQAATADLRLGNVYLAASDQPLDTFARGLPAYFDLIDTLTVTTAAGDPVLALSRMTDLQPRLGASQDGSADRLAARGVDMDELRRMINSDRITLVDLSISEIPGFKFSHGAWYENPWVSTDAMVALITGVTAEQRALASYEKDGFISWYFPADYLDRLKVNLLKLAESEQP